MDKECLQWIIQDLQTYPRSRNKREENQEITWYQQTQNKTQTQESLYTILVPQDKRDSL